MSAYRILIVDDETPMLRTVERILAGDHEVQSTPSSSAALELAPAFRPHLAIVDIRMPGMDGFELMNVLKRHDKDLQVILMTGSAYDIDDKLIRAIREKAFYYITKPFDREVLQTLVQRCLELRGLEDANRRHMQHLERQLAEARAFQMTMLPAPEARIGGFEIHAAYRPSTEVGGDLYDYASVRPDCVAMLIADVSGHGASAAMLTGIAKSAFRSSHVDQYAPQTVVRRVAEGIKAFKADRFITLLCARIIASDGILEYVNAGHVGGMVAGPARAPTPLQTTGPLVSPALPLIEWERETVAWETGSLALFYTDGIPETLNGEELFEEERLHMIVQRIPTGGAELLDAVLHEVEQFAQGRPAADDRTLLTVREA